MKSVLRCHRKARIKEFFLIEIFYFSLTDRYTGQINFKKRKYRAKEHMGSFKAVNNTQR